MTQTLPPSVQSRVDVVMSQLREVGMSDGQRWHVENAVINAAREAMREGQIAGRKDVEPSARHDGALLALRYLFEALGRMYKPTDLSKMQPNEAFGWGKALADSTLILVGEQIERGELSLMPKATPLAAHLPDFADPSCATITAAPPLRETEGEGV